MQDFPTPSQRAYLQEVREKGFFKKEGAEVLIATAIVALCDAGVARLELESDRFLGFLGKKNLRVEATPANTVNVWPGPSLEYQFQNILRAWGHRTIPELVKSSLPELAPFESRPFRFDAREFLVDRVRKETADVEKYRDHWRMHGQELDPLPISIHRGSADGGTRQRLTREARNAMREESWRLRGGPTGAGE